jgi:TolA-binding protein
VDFKEAQICISQGKYVDALKIFEGIISRSTSEELTTESLFWAGNINYLYLKKYQLAMERFEELVVAYPRSPWAQAARLNMATIYETVLNNRPAAILQYQEVIDFGPGTAEAALSQLHIAYCYDKLGEANQAITEAQTVLREYPNTEYVDDAILAIGDIYFMKGDYAQAEQTYQKLIHEYPQSDLVTDAKFNQAICLEEQGKWEPAVKKYKEIVDSHSNPSLVNRRIKKLQEKIAKKSKKWKMKW